MNEGIRQTSSWYVLRVPYGREMKLKAHLDSTQVRSFVPMQYKVVTVQGKQQKRLMPAIRNLLFAYTTREFLNTLKGQLEGKISFRYVMDKATKQPAIVSPAEMEQFIAVAGTLNEQLIYLTHIESTLKIGDRVLVTGGIFEGVDGHVIRIKGDRRVMVSINHLVAVATAHINPLLLRKINE